MKMTTVWGCPKCGNERDHFVPSPAPGFPSFYVCEHVPRLSDERNSRDGQHAVSTAPSTQSAPNGDNA